MDDTSQADQASAAAPDTTDQADQASAAAPDTTDQAAAVATETGNDDAARWAGNADDLALIAAAGRGEASSHEAFTALHRLLRQIVVAS